MSQTLNTSKFTTVWDDNFTKDSSLNTGRFPIHWGDSSEFAFINGLTLKSDGHSAGFMTPDTGPSAGNGYGLYQATFSMPHGQGAAGYIDLWPASNVWPGPEIDFVEQNASGQAYATVHWSNNGQNSYTTKTFPSSVDVSHPTTVAVDWEASGLTFYVNGSMLASYPQGGSVPVPKDYAHGGQNLSFGAGMNGPSGSTLQIYDMSYSHHI